MASYSALAIFAISMALTAGNTIPITTTSTSTSTSPSSSSSTTSTSDTWTSTSSSSITSTHMMTSGTAYTEEDYEFLAEYVRVEVETIKDTSFTCVFENKTFTQGQVVKRTNFTDCICATRSYIVCIELRCNRPQCINPQDDNSHACPFCPDGDNCRYQNEIINVGDILVTAEGMECACTDPWMEEAICMIA